VKCGEGEEESSDASFIRRRTDRDILVGSLFFSGGSKVSESIQRNQRVVSYLVKFSFGIARAAWQLELELVWMIRTTVLVRGSDIVS
jgi:hypothetical protein